MNSILAFSKRYDALRVTALVSVVLFFASNLYWAYVDRQRSQEQTEFVYVAAAGGTYPARLLPAGMPTIFEARNQVRSFAELTFGHDAETFDKHLEAALFLIDKEEGMAIYKDFEAGNVRENYVKYGSRSFFELDSIQIDMSIEPFEGIIYGRQVIVYRDQKKELPIGATYQLVRTRRSDNNPFGLLIKDWKFVRYGSQYKEKGGES